MPNCRAPTSGPSDSRASGASKVGVAAHITAASPGGPRYDATLTSDQRRSSDNGVWLCQTHAKQIDDDESRFTVQLLREWRRLAELRAEFEIGRSAVPLPPEASRGLVTDRRVLPHSREALREEVSTFLEDIGAPAAWGDLYELVRMTLYEIALNSAIHGNASRIEIESDGCAVCVHDDGARFGLADLRRADGRGGYRAVQDLDRTASGTFSLVYREADHNEWFVVDLVLTRGEDVPCAIPLEYSSLHSGDLFAKLDNLQSCDEIHLYPGKRWSYSDWYELLSKLGEYRDDVQFVVHGAKAVDVIGEFIHELLPTARIAD